MKPLTLALVRQRYTMDGGAERFVARTLSTLQNSGVNIVLVTRLWQPVQSVQVLPCNPFYLGSLWRDWGFARRACKILAQHPVDLVQSHERLACCDIYRAGDGVHREWLKQRRRALGWWGKLRLALNPYHYYVWFAEKRLFNSSRLRAVICNSQMVKEEIKRYFNLTEDKLHVIYSGIDTQEFHPDLQRHRSAIRERYAIPGDAVLFIFVGSGFERKGMDILLKAMPDLPEAAHLLIVGKDKKMHSFLSQAVELKVAARVHFLGAQQDVKPFYGAADVLVLPTLYDPFPNVVLEAMAAGLPVITSTKCGAAELILKNNCGFVCDALDTAGLVSAMRAMLDTAYAKSLGREARKTVEPISHDSMGMQLLSMYDELQGAREKNQSMRLPQRRLDCMEKLTVCLLTFNSARLLEQCIKPLLRVADELVVVDSGSSDATLNILSMFGITPVINDYTTHSDQMNFAISLSRNNWVLCVDSDEILDELTINNIINIKNSLTDETIAYRISRYWKVLNKPVRAIYPVSSPDFPVRLFNKRRVSFNGAPVDDKPIGFESSRVIEGHVSHDTFYSIREVFGKLNIYTSRLCNHKSIKPSLVRALISPYFAFVKWYFIKGSWRDGGVGLVAGAYAFLYTFLKYFKSWYHSRYREMP